MRRGGQKVFQNYERHGELVCRYVMRRMPGADRDVWFHILNLIWERAAERYRELDRKTEKEQRYWLFQIADQVIREEQGGGN